MGSIGRDIRVRRIALGLTQADLAAQVGDGVRQADISRLESGLGGPPQGVSLEQLATVLGFHPEALSAGSGGVHADPGIPTSNGQHDPSLAAGTGRLDGAGTLDHALALARGLVQALETLRQASWETATRDWTPADGTAEATGNGQDHGTG